MTTDPPPPPRRKWHLQRWLLLLAAGFLAYGGWTQYAFRAALKEARALGWRVDYTDPSEEIRANWKAAFRKATWLDGVARVDILTSEALEQHLTIVQRLNPRSLSIGNAVTLRDLSALKALTRLQVVSLEDCTGLTNVDALKNLSALRVVSLYGSTGLTNVDALKNLTGLRVLWLTRCTGLTEESVASLKAALPNTQILGP